MNIKTLVLKGHGINCENETSFAFLKAQSEVTTMNIDDFLELDSLSEYSIIAIPGGFSYGDEIKSGKILAEKIKQFQIQNINSFIDQGKLIIGICNGFQILCQLGLFGRDGRQCVTLSQNQDSKFINKWSKITVPKNNSIWLKDFPNEIILPIRHKEGNVKITSFDNISPVLFYQENENGSDRQIAAITNKKGNVLGMMPHPEAAINKILFPNHIDKKDEDYIALNIFKNAVNYAKELGNGSEKGLN